MSKCWERSDIGDKIFDLIIQLDITQREFSKKIGVRDSIVSMWISGQREPRIASVIKICQVFDVSADWILGIK